MKMYNTQFIAIADVLRGVRPTSTESPWFEMYFYQWSVTRDAMADMLATTNPKFDRERWLANVNGRVEEVHTPPAVGIGLPCPEYLQDYEETHGKCLGCGRTRSEHGGR